jgi:lysophospholipase L1-like esterase
VNPVTLEIGSNDVLQDFDQTTCTTSASADADVARMDNDLTRTILPQLRDAMGSTYQKGDLVMLNYYNPFARACSNSAVFVHRFNQHLADDAAAFGIPIVDVYAAFGGDKYMADNICDYTWICSAYHDIHPTTAGYRVIANAVEKTLGYPGIGGGGPIPLPAFGG